MLQINLHTTYMPQQNQLTSAPDLNEIIIVYSGFPLHNKIYDGETIPEFFERVRCTPCFCLIHSKKKVPDDITFGDYKKTEDYKKNSSFTLFPRINYFKNVPVAIILDKMMFPQCQEKEPYDDVLYVEDKNEMCFRKIPMELFIRINDLLVMGALVHIITDAFDKNVFALLLTNTFFNFNRPCFYYTSVFKTSPEFTTFTQKYSDYFAIAVMVNSFDVDIRNNNTKCVYYTRHVHDNNPRYFTVSGIWKTFDLLFRKLCETSKLVPL
jgi:hypothetical protein